MNSGDERGTDPLGGDAFADGVNDGGANASPGTETDEASIVPFFVLDAEFPKAGWKAAPACSIIRHAHSEARP